MGLTALLIVFLVFLPRHQFQMKDGVADNVSSTRRVGMFSGRRQDTAMAYYPDVIRDAVSGLGLAAGQLQDTRILSPRCDILRLWGIDRMLNIKNHGHSGAYVREGWPVKD